MFISGARSDDEHIAARQRQFFTQEFFPYCYTNDITRIFVLGDVFERRKVIDFKTLDHFEECFMKQIADDKYDLYISSGNHDVFHKSTNKLNSLDLLIGDRALQLYTTKPAQLSFGGTWIGVIPWMTEDNWDECIKFIETTSCPIIFGHFDIVGGLLNPGYASTFGLDPVLFNRFDLVVSGHYHTKSQIGNVHYLGTQYQMDWHDYGQVKGFHVFDSTTKTIEFIPSNLEPLFLKATYPEQVDATAKHVKLYVPEPSNETEDWIKRIKAQSPIEVEVFEGTVVTQDITSTDDNQEADSIIEQVLDSQTIDMKDKVKGMLLDLYKEARAQ